MKSRLPLALLAAALLVAAGGTQLTAVEAATTGVVFTMSNAKGGNRIVAWSRATNGALSFVGRAATGGNGSGGALNNQGGLALSPAGDWLLAVNAGSDSVSVFSVEGTALTRTDVEPSRGDRPISVALHDDLVYVLNAGGRGNIRGFRLSSDGKLTFIEGSGRRLSASGVLPVQIGFNPTGTRLVVSERGSDRLTRYRVTATGAADPPQVTSSAGAEPFGFEFTANGTLVVSEAGNHVNDGSSASSYRFNASGGLTTVSAAVPTTETAACWTAVTPDGRFAYVTNTPDHSISGFAIGNNGSLTMLDANGRTAATGAGSFPIDLDTSRDGEFLYVLAAGTDRILAYAIGANGSLASRPGVGGVPGAANGLVAR